MYQVQLNNKVSIIPTNNESQKLRHIQHAVNLPIILFFRNKISSNSPGNNISFLKKSFAKVIFNGLANHNNSVLQTARQPTIYSVIPASNATVALPYIGV